MQYKEVTVSLDDKEISEILVETLKKRLTLQGINTSNVPRADFTYLHSSNAVSNAAALVGVRATLFIDESPQNEEEPLADKPKYRVVVSIPHSVSEYSANSIEEAKARLKKERRYLLDDYPECVDVAALWIEELSAEGRYERIKEGPCNTAP